ncbi:MAG: LuxR C-terminal-related transcriptional regulator [Prolixibacteraceae bacterium]|jgi:DNA-binding CsgD family transcriptional regulator|nr:LuxR C-terminal-related transcriptional regulator [Prolixibacteraceae bacterium]
MKYKNAPKSSLDLFRIIRSKKYDPVIESYFSILRDELKQCPIKTLPNQYVYFYDFYHNQYLWMDENIFKILGYNKEELTHDLFIYDIIHPADRLLIYNATAKSIYYAHKYKDEVIPYSCVFSMDFRILKKNGEFIRILRNTGPAVIDRMNNMVFSFALNTDITNIKKSNVIRFDYNGEKRGVDYILKDSTINQDIFTKQEKNLLNFLAEGKTSQEIADNFFISKNTVDTHRRNMLRKSKLKNTTELVTFALEHQLI